MKVTSIVVLPIQAAIRPRIDDDFKPIWELELGEGFLEFGRSFADLDKDVELCSYSDLANTRNKMKKISPCLQCQAGMVMFPNDEVVHTLPLFNVHEGFMILGDFVRANDIVLALCQTRRMGAALAESPGVLQRQKLGELRLGRFLEKDLAEEDELAGIRGADDISGDVGFVHGQSLQWMTHLGRILRSSASRSLVVYRVLDANT